MSPLRAGCWRTGTGATRSPSRCFRDASQIRICARRSCGASFPIRRAGPADVDAVQPVARLIADANIASPVFAYVGEDFYDEIRPSTAELIENETIDY